MSTASLAGPRFGPAAGGPPRQLVVLLHGVGADGQDLIGLAPAWAPLLPHAEFIAPDGPEPCDMAPFGRQWFSLADRNHARMAAGVAAAAPAVGRFLDTALAERGLSDAQLALVGFSQGTMTALHVVLRREQPCAAVLGYSGALLGADASATAIRSRPPVLLVHGEADAVVPFQALGLAETVLRASGVPVRTLARPGLGHGIDEVGLREGGRFLAERLAASAGTVTPS